MNEDLKGKNRAQLNAIIWKRCIGKLSVSKYDDDMIREMREMTINQITFISRDGAAIDDYKLCTLQELRWVAQYLAFPGSIVEVKKVVNHFATRGQISKMRHLAIQCGLHYADFSCTAFTINGKEYSGKELREKARWLYDTQKLPGEITSFIYRTWANEKMHIFMKEAGLRYLNSFPKNTYYLRHDELTHQEADAIIKRFQKMYNEIAERYDSAKTYELN